MSAGLRHLLRAALTIAVLGGLVVVLGDERLGTVLGSIGLGAFLASMALNFTGSILIPALVSARSTAGTSSEMGLARFVVVNLQIRFFTMILPRAAVTGIRWVKYRARSGGSGAAAVVVLEKLVQIVVYAAVSGVCLAIEADRLGVRSLPLLVLAALLTVASGAGLLSFFTDRLDPVWTRLGGLVRVRRLRRPIDRVAGAVVEFRGSPVGRLPAIVALSVLGYGFFVGSAWVVAGALDLEVGLLGLAWMRGQVFLATLIPITIGGMGVREAGFVGFMALYSVDGVDALGFALALLGVQLALAALGGLLEMLEQLRPKAGREEG